MDKTFEDLQNFQKTQAFRGSLHLRVRVCSAAFRRNDLWLATFRLKPGLRAPAYLWTLSRLNHPVSPAYPVNPVSFFCVPILENQTL
jgi:hypothetical protein